MKTIRLLLFVCAFGMTGCEDNDHRDGCHHGDSDDYYSDGYYYQEDYVYYDVYDVCPNCGDIYYY
ncbi:MAG: hypothetical protein PHR77_18440 [Kiritimatiellae bacterium]|nr:hypothetical protein [Kiritimatiellia bacterium]MDD5520052.1 hypothetical protein [Kiritimatiellia bacterium]